MKVQKLLDFSQSLETRYFPVSRIGNQASFLQTLASSPHNVSTSKIGRFVQSSPCFTAHSSTVFNISPTFYSSFLLAGRLCAPLDKPVGGMKDK